MKFYIPSILQHKAHLIIETRFENSSGRRSKLGVCIILVVFGDRNVKFEAWHRRFWQWAIIGGVVVEPYFKGIQPLKLVKWVVHFIITLFWRHWTIDRLQINSIWRYNVCIWKWHLIFGSVYMHAVDRKSVTHWRSHKKYFFNTFHSIIMMIGVIDIM